MELTEIFAIFVGITLMALGWIWNFLKENWLYIMLTVGVLCFIHTVESIRDACENISAELSDINMKLENIESKYCDK